MAGFTLTPTPPHTHEKQWEDLLNTVKSMPSVQTAERKRNPDQIWVATTDTKKGFQDALKAIGINASVV